MKIGNRVIVNGEYAGLKIINEPGKIIAFVGGDVCVEFDNYIGIPFHSYNSILSAVETKNGYCWFASPEMITNEITMEERIEDLEQELAELKAHLIKKYEPQPGNYCILGDGDVELLNDWAGYVAVGRGFNTKEKADKARGIMVKHDIILKYVIDHAPDYKPDGYDCASIFFCRDAGKWKRVLASDKDECIGTILMPIKVADKLADDLNNNRIDFN